MQRYAIATSLALLLLATAVRVDAAAYYGGFRSYGRVPADTDPKRLKTSAGWKYNSRTGGWQMRWRMH
jgi:hypothetical protein